ncbi:MAG: hypothetical protein AB7S38_32545 [Vulcanimicrobiota bacterium]
MEQSRVPADVQAEKAAARGPSPAQSEAARTEQPKAQPTEAKAEVERAKATEPAKAGTEAPKPEPPRPSLVSAQSAQPAKTPQVLQELMQGLRQWHPDYSAQQLAELAGSLGVRFSPQEIAAAAAGTGASTVSPAQAKQAPKTLSREEVLKVTVEDLLPKEWDLKAPPQIVKGAVQIEISANLPNAKSIKETMVTKFFEKTGQQLTVVESFAVSRIEQQRAPAPSAAVPEEQAVVEEKAVVAEQVAEAAATKAATPVTPTRAKPTDQDAARVAAELAVPVVDMAELVAAEELIDEDPIRTIGRARSSSEHSRRLGSGSDGSGSTSGSDSDPKDNTNIHAKEHGSNDGGGEQSGGQGREGQQERVDRVPLGQDIEVYEQSDQGEQKRSSCPRCGTDLPESQASSCPICAQTSSDVMAMVKVHYRRSGEKFLAAADTFVSSDNARTAIESGAVEQVISLRYVPTIPGHKEMIRMGAKA